MFSKFELTNDGVNLLNRVIGEKKTLKFTKFQLGKGDYEGDKKTLTQLVSKFDEFNVSQTNVLANGITNIKGFYDNRNLSVANKLTEIGIMAQLGDDSLTEVLFSYSNQPSTDAETVPSKESYFSRTFSVMNKTDNVTSVTFDLTIRQDKYNFSTLEEMKSADYLDVGDKVTLWGETELGDTPFRMYIITDEVQDTQLINTLYAKEYFSVYDGVDSTSTTKVASAKAVKTAYDKGVEALDKANTKLDKGGYTGTALDLDNIKFGDRGDLPQITGELLDFKNKVKTGCYAVNPQQSKLLNVPYEQNGKLYVDYAGGGFYLRFITEMFNYNGDVGRGIYIIHINNFSPSSWMTFANTLKWYKLSMEDSLINLGNAGIPSIRYIQEVGEKLAGEGYIDMYTGKLYIAKVKNTDVTVTTNFKLATNIENAKDFISSNTSNFQIIAGTSFDGAYAKAIACKKLGRIGVVEFVNAELSEDQTFYLPSWFKPLYTATYGSIVSEDENKVVEVCVSKTKIVVYPSGGRVGNSTNGATGQVVVILEE